MFPAHQFFLELRNMPGDIDFLGTCFHAVENGMATPDAIVIVQNMNALRDALIPGIETIPVRL